MTSLVDFEAKIEAIITSIAELVIPFIANPPLHKLAQLNVLHNAIQQIRTLQHQEKQTAPAQDAAQAPAIPAVKAN